VAALPNTGRRHHILTSVDERDRPVFFIVMIVKRSSPLLPKRERHITSIPKIIAKEILNHIATISKAQNKIIVAEVGIVLHNVPKDWLPADRDHGLRAIFCFFPEPRTLTTAQYDDFHD
jgi:hypothetical protein